MGLLLSTRRALLGGAGGYDQKVLGTGPIAYWPQSESSGTTANCLVNPAQNGTYTGVTLANDSTGPFGTPAPFYDGANDYCNIFSAAFDAAFNGATGSMMIWFKVNAVGVWTDGVRRDLLMFLVDGNNNYRLSKEAANNTLLFGAKAGAGNANTTRAGSNETAWSCAIETWSDGNNDDEFKAFFDGVQTGATSAALNAWAGGGLVNTATLIGAATTGPAAVFHGWLGPCAIWDRVLSQAEITALYNC